MGFYTVNPGSPDYIMGSPIFDKVTIHLANGENFVIIANNNSTCNGKTLDKPRFYHASIANGGRLVLNLGHVPNKSRGSAPSAAPPSTSRG